MSDLPTIDSVQELTLKLRSGNGTLVAVENDIDLPFASRRVFFVYGVKGAELRGDHAHIKCKQALVCVRGRCEVAFDDGSQKRSVMLTSGSQLLYIPAGIWASEKYFSEDTVLAVFCDQLYDEGDYIRDYQKFLNFRGIRT